MSLESVFGERLPDEQRNCEKHGDYIAKHIFGKTWIRCPMCIAEIKEKEEADRNERDKLERDMRWQRKLGSSGIPLRFQDRTIPRFLAESEAQKEALQFAIDYASEFEHGHSGRCAVFLGKPGTGKTHLSCGIALRAMGKYGKSALFTTVAKMNRRIREAKSFDADETESEAIDLYALPDLLILDEVGLQSGTEAEARSLFDVINERYERCKPTIFMSNLNLEGMRDAIGERLFDRLREDGGQVLVFDWESHRGN